MLDEQGKVKKLAENIAEIMRNPETPAKLYNAMADALNDIAGEGENYDPKNIAYILAKGKELKPNKAGN